MGNFKSEFYKHLYTSVGPLIMGMTFLIWALKTGQNSLYLIGAVTIIVLAILAFMYVMGWMNRKIQMILSIVFLIGAVMLMWAVYGSVNDVLKFRKEKAATNKLVIQRLKDIRVAEIAFRDAHGVYTNDLDTLQEFIKHGMIPEVKKIGQKPDTLTELEALDLGLIVRDTVMEPAMNRFMNEKALKESRNAPFDIDAFIYAPPSDQDRFILTAGMIQSGGRNVPVFQAKDPKPFDPPDTLWVGSMTKSTTSGNWKGE